MARVLSDVMRKGVNDAKIYWIVLLYLRITVIYRLKEGDEW